jgi:hypothetical protein
MIYIFDIKTVIEWIVDKLKNVSDSKIKRKLRDNKCKLITMNENKNEYEHNDYYITENESIASKLLNIQLILKIIDNKCPMLLNQILTNKKLKHKNEIDLENLSPQDLVYYPYVIVN